MKKFSKITNQVIKEEPKLDNRIDESDVFRVKVISLMDQFLKIQSFGPVDNRYLAGKTKISGKETLAEALLQLFTDNSNDKERSILESLKSEVSDWEVIDKKIDSLSKKNNDINNTINIKNIIERYEGDSLLLFIENSLDKIKSIEKIKEYSEIVKESKIDKEVKNKILEIYKQKIDTL